MSGLGDMATQGYLDRRRNPIICKCWRYLSFLSFCSFYLFFNYCILYFSRPPSLLLLFYCISWDFTYHINIINYEYIYIQDRVAFMSQPYWVEVMVKVELRLTWTWVWFEVKVGFGLRLSWGWGWYRFVIGVEVEIELRLKLSSGWDWIEVELRLCWGWVEVE